MLKMPREQLLFLSLAALLAALAFFVFPPDGFYADDMGVRYIQMGSFARGVGQELIYPGQEWDPGLEWLGAERKFVFQDGVLRSSYQKLFPYLSSLLLGSIGSRVVLFLPLLAHLLSILVLFKTLNMLTDQRRLILLLGIGYALASPVVLYSVTFWEHVPALLPLWCGLYFLARYFTGARRPSDLGLGMLLIGSGVLLRSEMLILQAVLGASVAILLAAECRWRDLGWALGGAGIALAGYALNNLLLDGSLLGSHIYYNRPPSLPSIQLVAVFVALAAGGLGLLLFRRPPQDEAQWQLAALGIVWAGYLLVILRNSPAVRLLVEFPVGLLVLSWLRPRMTALEKLLAAGFVGFVSISALLMTANPHIDVRYLLPAVPLVIVFIALQFPMIARQRSAQLILLALFGLSFASAGWRMLTDISAYKRYNHERVAFLAEHTAQGDVVIFEANPLLEHAAPLYFDRMFFVGNSGARLQEIFSAAAAAGKARVFFWTMSPDGVRNWLESAETDTALASEHVFAGTHWLMEIALGSAEEVEAVLKDLDPAAASRSCRAVFDP